MNNITIKKASIKEGLFLEVSYEQKMENNVIDKFKRNSTAPIHDDLKNSFKALDLHLALICEQITIEEFENADKPKSGVDNLEISINGQKLSKKTKQTLFGTETEKELDIREIYSVDCFILSGNGDDAGVILQGSKVLKNHKRIYITSPLTKWDDNYSFSQELAEAIDSCKYEILLFLTEGKSAPSKQTSFDFPEENSDEDNQDSINF